MNRKDFYFEQLVTQADLDEAFDYAENADHFLQQDNGYIGIVSGLEVTEEATPDLTVDIAPGVAYDQDGQRTSVSAVQNLDCSQDSNAASTAVSGGGNEKWISIFIAFDRALSDPRVDGNGNPLQYERTEAFQFIVDQGAEAAAGTPAVYTSGNTENYTLANGQTLFLVVDGTPAQTITFVTGDFVDIGNATAAEVASVIQTNGVGVTAANVGGAVVITSAMTGPGASVRITGGTAAAQFSWPTAAAVGAGGPSRPALRADAILLADVLFRFGGTTIIDAPDDGTSQHVLDLVTRRETVFDYSGASFDIKVGTITEFATALAQEVTNHINETGSSHPATAIAYDPTVLPVPAGWSDTAAAGELQAAIDGIVNDLAQTTGTTGADLVGFDNTTANLSGAPANLQDALEDLLQGGVIEMGANTYNFTGDVNISGSITAVDEVQVAAGGRVQFNSAQQIRFGSGTPEGAVTASQGSIFLRDDGGAGTTFYVKESGVGNTGWVAYS